MFLTSKRLCFLCPQLKSSLANIRLGYNAVFVAIRNYKSCLECSIPAAEAVAVKDLNIVEDFITEEEEKCLIKEIEPKWRRLKYQSGHWDNVICFAASFRTNIIFRLYCLWKTSVFFSRLFKITEKLKYQNGQGKVIL